MRRSKRYKEGAQIPGEKSEEYATQVAGKERVLGRKKIPSVPNATDGHVR